MSSGLPTNIARSRTPREARDVLDHLGVVVGGQERLALAAVGHRQPADEVGQPDVGGPLLLGVLVEVVVELPGLVADPEVVVLSRTRSWNTMKLASRISSMRRSAWKQCRSCSADSHSMWPRLVRQLGARRMDALAACLEHRVTGAVPPVDLEVRMQPAELVRDGHVAPGVAEADRRGDVAARAWAATRPRGPARGRGGGATNSRSSRLTFTGSRTCGAWPAPSSENHLTARVLGERAIPSCHENRPRRASP